MRILHLTVFAALCGTASTPIAQTRRQLRLPTTEAIKKRLPAGVEFRGDIAYRKGDKAWRLDLAMPEQRGGQPRPGIVFVHGGGWRGGDKRGGIFLRGALDYARAGYVCITVNYRLTAVAPFPACIEDVKCAVRWFRAHADELNLDSDRIGAYGNSAGAHLVSLLGLAGKSAGLEGDGPWQEHSSAVQAVCASATPTDFASWRGGMQRFGRRGGLLSGPEESLAERAKLASPVSWVSDSAPPFLLFHGTADQVVTPDQGDRLYLALLEAGAGDVTYHPVTGAGHGVFMQHRQQTHPAMRAFFDRTLRRQGGRKQGSRKVIRPDGTPASLPFSPAIVSGDFVYLSGAIARDRSKGIEDQTRQVFTSMKRLLAAAGSDLSHAVRSNVYLTDARNFAAMNEVYRAQVGSDMPPVRATVEADLALPNALIEITLIATKAGVERQALVPEGWPAPTRPYSWGIRVKDTVFLSGIVSRDPAASKLVLGDAATQTRQVLENVKALLASAGMTMRDVVSSNVYLTDARDFRAMNEVYREFFSKDDPPARATVRTRLMHPELLVEIQCIAVKSRTRRVVMVEGATRSSSPFSPSILTGERQFLAGMVGRGPQGYAAGDIEAQTRQTIANLRATLEAAGLGLDHVVESTVYLADVRHFAAMNRVYRELLPKAPPIRTTVGAQLMSPAALVEIMFSAAR